ncbi:MAG: tetratricopeptide repeat protein [Candidatus Omnitrophica bacterium]|nr:tetratricopeptide repeat protein [Candidatus Omnitrophota bacterium]
MAEHKSKWRGTFIFLLTRVGVLYIVFVCAVYLITDKKMFQAAVRTRMLNDLMPHDYNLLVRASSAEMVKREDFTPFTNYYKKVVELLPNKIPAYGLLAFCQYYQGDVKNAVENYVKATILNPSFFWFYHNLSVIYFHRGNYQAAGDTCRKALLCEGNELFVGISNSLMFYSNIFSEDARYQGDFKRQFHDGYRDCLALMVEAACRLKHYDEALAVAMNAIEQRLDTNGYFLYKSGVASYQLGDYGNAAGFFKAYLDKNPDPIGREYLSRSTRQLALKKSAGIVPLDPETRPLLGPMDFIVDQIQLQPY